jgi:hypothetical protein
MKCISIGFRMISLKYPSQGCKVVEETLRDLVTWLTKLKDSILTTTADDDREEAERREQLTRFLSHPYRSA